MEKKKGPERERENVIKKVQERFPPYYGPEWEKKVNDPGHPNFWKYGVANHIFLDFVSDKKIVLDVGCGTGGSTRFLAKKCETDLIVGVDVVKTMIKVAKERTTGEHETEFMVCDGRKLPFKDSSFEALVSRGDVLPWLIPQDKALQEFNRVMRSGAVIVAEVDNPRNMKLNTAYSYFERAGDGKISYVVNRVDTNRNHSSTYYVLRKTSNIAKNMLQSQEFINTGHYPGVGYSLEEIERQTTEIRQGLTTHWHTADEIRDLFEECGFEEIEVMGNGLLMQLMLEGDEIVQFMKRHPEPFFKIEKRLVRFVDPKKAPTIIVKGLKK